MKVITDGDEKRLRRAAKQTEDFNARLAIIGALGDHSVVPMWHDQVDVELRLNVDIAENNEDITIWLGDVDVTDLIGKHAPVAMSDVLYQAEASRQTEVVRD